MQPVIATSEMLLPTGAASALVAASVLVVYAPWLLGLWIAAVGACVGSFLNVVIHRVPAGLSIVAPRSRCPRCLRPIRGRDNIPVLSWLLLRGKCRDCGTRISIRYPLIESVVAVIFALLYLADIEGHHSTAWISLTDGPSVPRAAEQWCVLIMQAWLFATILAASMIEWDRKPIALRIFVPLIVIRVMCLAFLPRVASGREPVAMTVSLLLATGLACLGHRASASRMGLATWLTTTLTVAAIVGWQSMLIVTGCVAIGLAWGRLRLRRSTFEPNLGWVFAGTLCAVLGRVPFQEWINSARPQPAVLAPHRILEATGPCHHSSSNWSNTHDG